MNLGFIEKLSQVKEQAELNSLMERGYDLAAETTEKDIDYSAALVAVLKYGTPDLVAEVYSFISARFSDEALSEVHYENRYGIRSEQNLLKFYELAFDRFSSSSISNSFFIAAGFNYNELLKYIWDRSEELVNNDVISSNFKRLSEYAKTESFTIICARVWDKITSDVILEVFNDRYVADANKYRLFEVAKDRFTTSELDKLLYNHYYLPAEVQLAIIKLPIEKLSEELISWAIRGDVYSVEIKQELFAAAVAKEIFSMSSFKKIFTAETAPKEVRLQILEMFMNDQLPAEVVISGLVKRSYLKDEAEFQLQIFDHAKTKFSAEDFTYLFDKSDTYSNFSYEILKGHANKLSAAIIVEVLTTYNLMEEEFKLEVFVAAQQNLSASELVELFTKSKDEMKLKIVELAHDRLPLSYSVSIITGYGSSEDKLDIFRLIEERLTGADFCKLLNSPDTPEYIKDIIFTVHTDELPVAMIVSELGRKGLNDQVKYELYYKSVGRLSAEDLNNLVTSYGTADAVREDILLNHIDQIQTSSVISIITRYDIPTKSKLVAYDAVKDKLSAEQFNELFQDTDTPEKVKNNILLSHTDDLKVEVVIEIIAKDYRTDNEVKLKLFTAIENRLSNQDFDRLFHASSAIRNLILENHADKLSTTNVINGLIYSLVDEAIKLKLLQTNISVFSSDDLTKIFNNCYSLRSELVSLIVALPVQRISLDLVTQILKDNRVEIEDKLKLFESAKDKLSTEQLSGMLYAYSIPQEVQLYALEKAGLSVITGDVMNVLLGSSLGEVVKGKIFELTQVELSEENLVTLFNSYIVADDIKLRIVDLLDEKLITGGLLSYMRGYFLSDNVRVKLLEKYLDKFTEADIANLKYDNFITLPDSIKIKILELVLSDDNSIFAKHPIALLSMSFSDPSLSDELKLQLYLANIDKFTVSEINEIFAQYYGSDIVGIYILENSYEILTSESISARFIHGTFKEKAILAHKIIEVASERLSNEVLELSLSSLDQTLQLKVWELLKDSASESAITAGFIGAQWTSNEELLNNILQFTNGVISTEARVSILQNQLYSQDNTQFTQTVLSHVNAQLQVEDIYKAVKGLVSSGHLPVGIETYSNRLTQHYSLLLMKEAVTRGCISTFNKVMELLAEKVDDHTIPELVKTSVKYNKLNILKALVDEKGEVKEGQLFERITVELIDFLKNKGLIDERFVQEVAREHFTKGNFETSYKFMALDKMNGLDDDAINIIVDAIQLGLSNSVEPNKYQALLQLINKAGIKLPQEHQHKLREVVDNSNPADFKFIDGLTHKLAKHYHSLSERLSDALIMLDNDFALEVLTINGATPSALKEELTVFRGMRTRLDEDEINNFFEYGHRAYSTGEFQKLLGYYISKEWNAVPEAVYQLGGTYVSFSPETAAGFGQGGIMFEIKLPQGSAKTCGYWINGKELIPSYISGKDIVAVYNLNFSSEIVQVYINPSAGSKPKFNVGDKVIDTSEVISEYQRVCQAEGNIEVIGDLYLGKGDFYAKYTPRNIRYQPSQVMGKLL
ncbi:MAG: hypothetical protein ACHP6I_01625 [Rickettsiales bacterium]